MATAPSSRAPDARFGGSHPPRWLGGVIGAVLLLVLPAEAFQAIVPVLIGIGLVLVVLGPRLQAPRGGPARGGDRAGARGTARPLTARGPRGGHLRRLLRGGPGRHPDGR